jgi:hypothetical protein
MVHAASQNGGIDHLQIDEDMVGRHLYTRHLPDPDLVVRTSGEMRLSNFLLWQLAYAEIYVTPTLWPDFRGVHLLEGIAEYQKRERRYGGLNHGDGHGATTQHEMRFRDFSAMTGSQQPRTDPTVRKAQRWKRCATQKRTFHNGSVAKQN